MPKSEELYHETNSVKKHRVPRRIIRGKEGWMEVTQIIYFTTRFKQTLQLQLSLHYYTHNLLLLGLQQQNRLFFYLKRKKLLILTRIFCCLAKNRSNKAKIWIFISHFQFSTFA